MIKNAPIEATTNPIPLIQVTFSLKRIADMPTMRTGDPKHTINAEMDGPANSIAVYWTGK